MRTNAVSVNVSASKKTTTKVRGNLNSESIKPTVFVRAV